MVAGQNIGGGTTGIQHQTPLAPAYIFLAPLRRHWRVQDILTKGAAVPHRYYWHSATRRPLGTTTQLRPATAGTAAAPQIMVLISGKFEKNPSIGVSPLAIAGSLSGFTERGHCQSLGAAVTCEPHIMHSLKPEERRGSVRRHLYNIVKMQIGADTAPRECLILDISDEVCGSILWGSTSPISLSCSFLATISSRRAYTR
jgi:hypothetical protein